VPAVHITWTASPNAASYIVNRNGAAYSSALASTTTAYDDINVTVGQTYTYTVTATNSGGSTLSSGQAVAISSSTCPTVSPPTAPVLSVSTICNGTSPANHLSWTASADATSYRVFRNGTALPAPLPSSALAYDDNSVAPGQTYSYSVQASNSGGHADSNTFNISLLSSVCQPLPQSFTLSASAFCGISSTPAAGVILTWTSSANATGYFVFRDDKQVGSVATTAFIDNDSIVAGQNHTYFVRATGPGGTIDSNIVEVHVDPLVCNGPCSFSCAATVATSAPAMSAVLFVLQQQSSCDTAGVTWTFGDGTVSNELAPFHMYKSAGTFGWSATVGACQNSGTIIVTPEPPSSKRRAVRH